MSGLTPAVPVRSAAAPATTTKTPTTNRLWRAPFAAIILLLAASALIAGCGDVMVTGSSAVPAASGPSQALRPSGATEVPVTREVHDLAVAAVDFDPELSINTVLSGRPFSL